MTTTCPTCHGSGEVPIPIAERQALDDEALGRLVFAWDGSGAELWDDLAVDIREDWIAAARAVRDAVLARMGEGA